jgi:hypothetical protein
MSFNVGDVVKCIDAGQMNRLKNGQHYTIRKSEDSYLYLKEIDGGFFKRRFIITAIHHPMMDGSEYDDIMLAQDIYGKVEG